MKRVAILGRAGAGKSTLAREIGKALGLRVVHLDVLVYGPNWRRLPISSVRERLADLMKLKSWVVEGTYPELADLSLSRADLIVWSTSPPGCVFGAAGARRGSIETSPGRIGRKRAKSTSPGPICTPFYGSIGGPRRLPPAFQ